MGIKYQNVAIYYLKENYTYYLLLTKFKDA